ncbi:hypothetical protein PORY_001228 [Pneumocystis oryctolagi]|uniref:Uncharacterized protein n=1 Tax=Pneumocystis oryctolagi TaxID=42067 RepID=A0ACB7CD26_9ASCO|nr:hypothetical protein PORY_001228 [Pneumocystis oryctolagi]
MYGIIFLSYLGLILGFSFLTICIACGLYYLSEFIEEYSEFSKKLIKRQIYMVIFLHFVLLIFDKLSFFFIIFSVLSHILYLLNLRSFPCISVSSLLFRVSVVFTVLNHMFWIWNFKSYFTSFLADSFLYLKGKSQQEYTFAQIASFFGICVWLTPFSLFVSLPAGDNVLPVSLRNSSKSNTRVTFTQNDKHKRIGLVKTIFLKVKIYIDLISQNLNWNDQPSKISLYI